MSVQNATLPLSSARNTLGVSYYQKEDGLCMHGMIISSLGPPSPSITRLNLSSRGRHGPPDDQSGIYSPKLLHSYSPLASLF